MFIRVVTSYMENSAFYRNGDAWKPKGAQTFHFPFTDAGNISYVDEEVLKSALIAFVREQNTELYRYEYESHEVIFLNPITVDGLESMLADLNC